MMTRIRILGFGLAALASASFSIAVAQTIPELFGKVKAEVKAASWADALKTLDALEAEAAKPGNEDVQKQLAGPLAFYRGVCSANLGQKDEAAASFTTFLKLQPNATIDAAVYSKKAVAAFEKAQKDLAARAPSLAEAFKEFQPAANAKETDPADQYWGDGPARWILTDSEKSAWTGLYRSQRARRVRRGVLDGRARPFLAPTGAPTGRSSRGAWPSPTPILPWRRRSAEA